VFRACLRLANWGEAVEGEVLRRVVTVVGEAIEVYAESELIIVACCSSLISTTPRRTQRTEVEQPGAIRFHAFLISKTLDVQFLKPTERQGDAAVGRA